MLNVRLNSEEEKELADYCEKANLTKSQVVKEALALYLSSKAPSKSAYELGEDLFGRASGGDCTDSTQYKQKLKTKLSEKHTH